MINTQNYEALDDFWREYVSFAFESDCNEPQFLFRGVSDRIHLLIPELGRRTCHNNAAELKLLELRVLEEFKRLSAPIMTELPNSDLEWMFLAQHYGLPTRLLDWTTNPLVALYFAVEKDDDTDAAVYAVRHQVSDQYDIFDYQTADYTKAHKQKFPNCVNLQNGQGKVIFLRPKYTDQRYLNQRAVFSCPKDPFHSLDLAGLSLHVLKGEWKFELRGRLRAMGICASHIYPGLDGIAHEVKSVLFDPMVK